MFNVVGVSKSFKVKGDKKFSIKKVRKYALEDVSFIINKGEAVALVGANGSGKSTLVNLMTGLYKPDNGALYFDGTPITGVLHMKHVSICLPNGTGLVMDMTIAKYLEYRCRLYNKTYADCAKVEYIQKIIQLLDIEPNKKISHCSSGQRQKVALLSSLIVDSQVIIFDEPTSNLDIRNKYIFLDILDILKKKNKTIILISHDTTEIVKMERVIMLADGRLVCDMEAITDRDALDKKILSICNVGRGDC